MKLSSFWVSLHVWLCRWVLIACHVWSILNKTWAGFSIQDIPAQHSRCRPANFQLLIWDGYPEIQSYIWIAYQPMIYRLRHSDFRWIIFWQWNLSTWRQNKSSKDSVNIECWVWTWVWRCDFGSTISRSSTFSARVLL